MRAGFVFIALLPVALEAQSPGTFIPTGSMSTWRYAHTATLLNDGRVLIAGGLDVAPLASAELYDPSSGTFKPTGNMITARLNHTATLLANGKVLIAGGWTGSANLASMELFDPSAGTFSPAGNMSIARSFHSAVLLKSGKVLLVGGGTSFLVLISAELYDPDTGSITVTGSTSEGEAHHGLTLLANGNVFHAPIGNPPEAEGTADLYDPSSGRFRPTGVAPPWPYILTQNLLANGKVLVTSGAPECDYASADALVYDPVAEAFTVTGSMVSGRCSHTGTTLSDGTVLISGSLRGTNVPNAEIYDPASGVFTKTDSMVVPSRYAHTATLLKDGRVLLVGGLGAPALAELYVPRSVAPPPYVFSLSGDGRGPGAILHGATQQVVSSDNPAVSGEALEIFGTGLLDGAVIPPQVAIGGRMAEVLWFGNAPGFTGLNQINVRMPSDVMPGAAVAVRLNYLGRPSNDVTIAVQ